MGFLSGFIASQIDEQGNSNVVRMDLAEHAENMYSIDSERVEDVHIVQEHKQIKPDIAIFAGEKSLLQRIMEGANPILFGLQV